MSLPISATPMLKASAPPRPRRGSALRMAVSALLAASAYLLLSSSSSSSSDGESDAGIAVAGGAGSASGAAGERKSGGNGRYLSKTDPILTNLARIEGSESAADAIHRATFAGRRGQEGDEPAQSVTPVYWHIYKAGGTSVKTALTFCLDLTTARETGVYKGHDKDTEIAVMRAGGHNYVNVDTISWDGVDRAAKLGLAESGLADAVVTPIIHKTITTVFSPQHRGLLFTVFRHPVDRLVSQYYYLQEASWEKTYNPDIAKETLGDYARKFNNRLIRQLIGKDLKPTALTQADLDLAKFVVKSRMLVGLMSDTEGAVRRFIRYFGWDQRPELNREQYQKCMEETFTKKDKKDHGGANQHSHPKVEKGSKEWEEVAKANKWDIKLYEYILEVYEEQGKMFGADEETAASVS